MLSRQKCVREGDLRLLAVQCVKGALQHTSFTSCKVGSISFTMIIYTLLVLFSNLTTSVVADSDSSV